MAATFDLHETDYAYFAGILDGEGHVGLYRHRDKKCKRGFAWRVMMGVTNTQIPLLLDLQRRFGGVIEKQGKSAFNGRQVWGLRFSTNAMRAILPKLLPYLILKRRDAEIMLSAMRITARHRFSDYDDSGMEPLVREMNIIRLERRKIA